MRRLQLVVHWMLLCSCWALRIPLSKGSSDYDAPSSAFTDGFLSHFGPLLFDPEDYTYGEVGWHEHDLHEEVDQRKNLRRKIYPKKYDPQKDRGLEEEVTQKSLPEDSEDIIDEAAGISTWNPPEEATVPENITEISFSTEISLEPSDSQDPIVLPVTEGKQRPSEVYVQYGLPKELLPIYPGGGSRFDDVEKEKFEKEKMSQTKDTNEASEASHDAEGLLSSAVVVTVNQIVLFLSTSYLIKTSCRIKL